MESPKAERLLRVGLVQMNTVPCEAAENRKTAERLIRRAAEAGADLVVLPETWNVGFFPDAFLLIWRNRRTEKAVRFFHGLRRSLASPWREALFPRAAAAPLPFLRGVRSWPRPVRKKSLSLLTCVWKL